MCRALARVRRCRQGRDHGRRDLLAHAAGLPAVRATRCGGEDLGRPAQARRGAGRAGADAARGGGLATTPSPGVGSRASSSLRATGRPRSARSCASGWPSRSGSICASALPADDPLRARHAAAAAGARVPSVRVHGRRARPAPRAGVRQPAASRSIPGAIPTCCAIEAPAVNGVATATGDGPPLRAARRAGPSCPPDARSAAVEPARSGADALTGRPLRYGPTGYELFGTPSELGPAAGCVRPHRRGRRVARRVAVASHRVLVPDRPICAPQDADGRAAGVLAALHAAVARVSGARPNIVLVMADQLAAAFLPCYGHPVVHAPHLDGAGALGHGVRERLLRLAAVRAVALGHAGRPARVGDRGLRQRGRARRRRRRRSPICCGRAATTRCSPARCTSSAPTSCTASRSGSPPTCTRPASTGRPTGGCRRRRACPGTTTCPACSMPACARRRCRRPTTTRSASAPSSASASSRSGPDRRPFFLAVSFTNPHDPWEVRARHWDIYADRAIDPPAVPRDPARAGRSAQPAPARHVRHRRASAERAPRSCAAAAPTTPRSATSTSASARCSRPCARTASATTRWSRSRPTTARWPASAGCGSRCRSSRAPRGCRCSSAAPACRRAACRRPSRTSISPRRSRIWPGSRLRRANSRARASCRRSPARRRTPRWSPSTWPRASRRPP